jgi:ubiquinone/menaquinone biosynthesis C-methylase UbiE
MWEYGFAWRDWAYGRGMYIHGHHESVLTSHRWRTADNSAAYLLPHLTSGASLLDIGSGPGTITADLAALVAPGIVTALEMNADALALTRTELDARGVSAHLVVGDVHRLDFDDDSFDVVHAHQVLQHVVDPVKALTEMRRVTRPGGIVAARDGDYAAFTWYPQIPELDEWLALYRRIARADGGQPDAGRRLMSWAYAAGFTDVTPTISTWLYATPADREWWGGMWSRRIVESNVARQAVDLGEATREDLLRMSAAWTRWSNARDGWFAVPHGEILCRV